MKRLISISILLVIVLMMPGASHAQSGDASFDKALKDVIKEGMSGEFDKLAEELDKILTKENAKIAKLEAELKEIELRNPDGREETSKARQLRKARTRRLSKLRKRIAGAKPPVAKAGTRLLRTGKIGGIVVAAYLIDASINALEAFSKSTLLSGLYKAALREDCNRINAFLRGKGGSSPESVIVAELGARGVTGPAANKFADEFVKRLRQLCLKKPVLQKAKSSGNFKNLRNENNKSERLRKLKKRDLRD